MINRCEELQASVGSRFECSKHSGDLTRIRTPFLYPDGDFIDVFCTDDGTVSDCGESTRWLRNQTVSNKRSLGQRRLIDDICQTNGVEFFKGMVQSRVGNGTVGDAVIRVAQASLRIADIWFTFRSRSIQTVNDDVSAVLTEAGIPFDQSVPLIGRSGRTRTVDFQARAPQRTSLVLVLSTGSRSAANMMIDRAVAEWYDLSHLRLGSEPLQFVSLFDDTLDIWRDSDFKNIEDFSIVARWSAPEQFVDILQAA